MPHVVSAIPIVVLEATRQDRGASRPKVEGRITAIRNFIQAIAVRIIHLKGKTPAHTLLSRDLEGMIGTTSASIKFDNPAKSRVWSRVKRYRSKAALAPSLERICTAKLVLHLDRTRAEILYGQAIVLPELMLDARTPLHAVGIWQLTTLKSIEVHNRDTACLRSEGGSTRQCATCKI